MYRKKMYSEELLSFFRCMCGIGATNSIFYIAEPDGYSSENLYGNRINIIVFNRIQMG